MKEKSLIASLAYELAAERLDARDNGLPAQKDRKPTGRDWSRFRSKMSAEPSGQEEAFFEQQYKEEMLRIHNGKYSE
jgi:hypothetical protein